MCFTYDDGAVVSAAADGCVMVWRREGAAARADEEVAALVAASTSSEHGDEAGCEAQGKGDEEMEGLDRRAYLAAIHPPTIWEPPRCGRAARAALWRTPDVRAASPVQARNVACWSITPVPGTVGLQANYACAGWPAGRLCRYGLACRPVMPVRASLQAGYACTG